jgi:nucleotide-binding universal stress UspA family protein
VPLLREEGTMNPALNGNGGRRGTASCPFRHVLVGWDGSPDSVMALRTAVAIVGDAPGRVTALAVVPDPRPPEDGHDKPADVEHAREAFEMVQAGMAGAPCRVNLHTAEGRHVARSICDYATEHGFDLLVLGRHGDGGLLHPKLGHIAEAAARGSKIPVLLVSAS